MSKLPSGAEWGQFRLQPKVNSAKKFVKNLKAPSAKNRKKILPQYFLN
jgi:hypothetical protein